MTSCPNITALVIAAGYSSRMKMFKPLLPLRDCSVIERTINTFHQAGIQDVRVVVGHQAENLFPLLDALNIKIIHNQQYAQGMFSSIKTGVEDIEKGIEAFYIQPADIPMVQVNTIKNLLQVFYKVKQNKDIIYPCFKGERGHPPLIANKYQKDILNWQGPEGLRGLLSKYSSSSFDLDVADEGVMLDMDVPEDYQKILSYLPRRSIPNKNECQALLESSGVSSQVINHSQAVADLAKKITISLNNAGCNLNVDLITAGALLHDIAKGKPRHATVGAKMLKRLGYKNVAQIVELHMDINLHYNNLISEAAIVYLADKLTKENIYVPLEFRFKAAINKYYNKLEVLEGVLERLRNALEIKECIEKALGYKLTTFIRYEGNNDGTKTNILS